MQGYSEFIREFAGEKGIAVCDYNKYLTEIMQEKEIFRSDHVHLQDLGQFYMAKCFLKLQGEDLGDFFPLPEYLSKWREEIQHLRDVYSAEYLILHTFFLDAAQGSQLIHEYLEKTPNVPDVYQYFAQQYFSYKPILNELRNKIVRLTNAFYE